MTASRPFWGIVGGAIICVGGGAFAYYGMYGNYTWAWLYGTQMVNLGVAAILVSLGWGVAGHIVSFLLRNHLVEPMLRWGNAIRRVLFLCTGLALVWWVYALVQGYNDLETVFHSPPPVEAYAYFFPALILPTAIAAGLAVCQSILQPRSAIMLALGSGCVMASGLALYNLSCSQSYSHDLSHTIFQECSGQVGDVHELLMTSVLLFSLLSTGIVIYRSQPWRTIKGAAEVTSEAPAEPLAEQARRDGR